MATRSSSAAAILIIFAVVVPYSQATKASLFLFGDSLLDVGNNEFIPNSTSVANVPPYGETFFHKPSGRFSNGLIISDFIARFMGLPFLPPSLKPGANFSQGANFASGGSGILDTTNAADGILTLSAQIIKFQNMVSQWKMDRGNETVVKQLASSIFILSAGGNDLLGGYLQNATARGAYTPLEYVDYVLKEYKIRIQMMYEAGGRKFVISGMGPLGCTPILRVYSFVMNGDTECYNVSNDMSKDFNAKLRRLQDELTVEYPEAKFTCIQSYEYFMDMIENGTKYGFTVTTDNCCGGGLFKATEPCGPRSSFVCHKPSKYLFWDFHPTHKALWYLSNAIWNGTDSFMQPINLKELIEL